MTIPADKAKIVEDMVKLCVRHLRKKKYELNLPKSAVKNAVNRLHVYKRRNGRSWAGRNKLAINVLCWQFGNSVWTEYKRFNDDPVIGRIEVTDNKDILLCLVAHEVSHFIQYTYTNWFPLDIIFFINQFELISFLNIVEIDRPLQGIFHLRDQFPTGATGLHRIPQRGFNGSTGCFNAFLYLFFVFLHLEIIFQVHHIIAVRTGFIYKIIGPLRTIFG